MKACADCKHFRQAVERPEPYCERFAKYAESEDVVYGKRNTLSAPACRDARAVRGQCGPNGRSWEFKYAEIEQREEPRTESPPAGSVIIVKPTEPVSWWRKLLAHVPI